jgi:hypothetical protein
LISLWPQLTARYHEIFNVWSAVMGTDEMPAGMFYGASLQSTYKFYLPSPIRICYFTPVDGDYVQARYWRLLPVDPTNPDGYFEWGQLFLGIFGEFLWQVDYTGDHILKDNTDNRRSAGGQRWPKRKPTYRGRRLPWTLLSRPDPYWRLEFFLLQMGISDSFIIDPYPDGLAILSNYSRQYGHLVDFYEITGVSSQYRTTELQFEEDL